MRERPTGADLLATARAELESRLLPKLDGPDRHTARMILRAMDLAMREMQHADALDQAEDLGLASLLRAVATAQVDNTDNTDNTTPTDATPSTLNRHLATTIRRGDLDPGTPHHQAALQHLKAVSKGRLQISDPRKLK